MNPIEENALRTLQVLVDERENDGATDESLLQKTALNERDLRDAVEYLEDQGGVEVLRELGNPLFAFVRLLSRGTYLYHELSRIKQGAAMPVTSVITPYNPVGSPFGFTDEDWETVALKRKDATRLYVVMGLQFQSTHYNTNLLLTNFQGHFERALVALNTGRAANPILLSFTQLQAGLGAHLFNSIASSIIGADIAVFDTSDLNPNVMIEMGVALTWGVRVLPVRERNTPSPPSDISGQTWVKYTDSGQSIVESPDFDAQLREMFTRAISKKGRV